MHTNVSKIGITELQAEAIDTLDRAISLMERAVKVFAPDRYGAFARDITAQVNKVKNLELKMVIVAPMKAGKSTIINAIDSTFLF